MAQACSRDENRQGHGAGVVLAIAVFVLLAGAAFVATRVASSGGRVFEKQVLKDVRENEGVVRLLDACIVGVTTADDVLALTGEPWFSYSENGLDLWWFRSRIEREEKNLLLGLIPVGTSSEERTESQWIALRGGIVISAPSDREWAVKNVPEFDGLVTRAVQRMPDECRTPAVPKAIPFGARVESAEVK